MASSLGGFWRPQGVAYQRKMARDTILEELRAKWSEQDKQTEVRKKERRVTKAAHAKEMAANAIDITDLVHGLKKVK